MIANGATPDGADEDFFLFESADAGDKRLHLQKLIDKSPDRCFRIPPTLGRRAQLAEAFLPEVWLAGAQLMQADLRSATLRGAMLGGAELSEALLESADLREADLVGAKLQHAEMGECLLQGALLEDCVLSGASLRFADLRSAALERADLHGADLWGARLDGVQAAGAAFVNATFGESSVKDGDFCAANFSGAAVSRVDFRGSSFVRAQFENARFSRVDMRNVSFQEATLSNVNLSTCLLEGSRFADAWLERTRMRREQLGGAIGEDIAKEWRGAASAYLALERNFVSLGDQDSARWAYGKRRRMEKNASYADAVRAVQRKDFSKAIRSASVGVGAELVETVCDYGESIVRVMSTIIILFLGFAVVYGLTGGVVQAASAGKPAAVTHDVVNLLAFSALAMTTLGTPNNLIPANVGVDMLRGTESFLAIFLTGLLGFVAGNRIRR